MLGGGITSDVIFVGGVDFFYSSVAEGQLSHPVHASSHARGQTQVGTGGRCVETISAEVVRTEAKTREEKKRVSQQKSKKEEIRREIRQTRRFGTSDPGRCRRRTRRRYVPGRIPGETQKNSS